MSNPPVKKGWAIAIGVTLLMAGVVLIALGLTGVLPLVFGIVPGFVLMAAVLSVVVFQLVRNKLITSKSKFDRSNIKGMVQRYREEQKLPLSIGYKTLETGTLDCLPFWEGDITLGFTPRVAFGLGSGIIIHPLVWIFSTMDKKYFFLLQKA